MEIDTNPYRKLQADITPTEFEIFCMDTLKAYAEKEGLKEFKIEHNKKIETYDSTYQIDVFAEYIALGCNHKVVIECKHQGDSIKRAIVTDLYTKIQSMGAQKGILISTSGFQKGAVRFAGAHGIALWQIVDARIKHIKNSVSRDISLKTILQMEMERYLPKYFMLEWDCDADFPYNEIYPTPEMYQQSINREKEILKREENICQNNQQP